MLRIQVLKNRLLHMGVPATFNGCASGRIVSFKRVGIEKAAILTSIKHKFIDTVVIYLPHSVWSMNQVATRSCVSNVTKNYSEIPYLYLSTSANKKESWKLVNRPPPGLLTLVISENPDPTLVVAFIATNAFHAHFQTCQYRKDSERIKPRTSW